MLNLFRFVFVWVLVVPFSVFAQTPRTAPLQIADLPAPVIDGVLDEQVWAKATRIGDFHQTRPNDHGAPSERTEVQIAIDDDTIYLAFRVYDSEIDQLVAKGLIQGQNFFSDDRVGVNFDTFNDRRNSYFFQVNANAIRREALTGNDYFIDEWDTVWFAETKVYDWGWVAEMAIPTKSIAFDPNSTTWGVNFTRQMPRRGEELAWSSLDRNSNPSHYGYMDDISGLTQGLGLEIAPSVSLGYIDDGDSGSDTLFEPSITTFYNITPSLTAGLTLNTDFSATEVDDRQVNLGRFSLFFPEKREFFLRDASIFEFGGIGQSGRPFFSRRIGLSNEGNPLGIDVGAKLSGRAGDWNLGALAIKQETGVDGADENLFVGRASRNVFDESQIGVIATYGDPTSTDGNSLIGVDYNYRNSHIFGDQTVSANFWYQQTDTDGFNDQQSAFGAQLDFPNDKISGFIDFKRIEENFNPALGFVNRRGTNQIDTQIRYKHRLEDNFWQWYRTRLQLFRSELIDGGLQSEFLFWNFFEGFSKGNDFFRFFVGRIQDGVTEPFDITEGLEIQAGEYSSNRYGFFFETGPQRPLRMELEIANGDHFGGTRLQITPKIEWRPNKHFFASIALDENRIKLPQGNFTSRLFSARLNYAFNSKWAWLNVAQADNSSDVLSLNSRIRYQPRADREYFLVFNQNRDRVTDEILDTAIIFKASFNFRM